MSHYIDIRLRIENNMGTTQTLKTKQNRNSIKGLGTRECNK